MNKAFQPRSSLKRLVKILHKTIQGSTRKFNFAQLRHGERPRQNYRFLFVVGASGSGTTMLTRILAYPNSVVGIGGMHISIPQTEKEAYQLATYHNQVNALLWDRYGSLEQYQWAKHESLWILDELLSLPQYKQIQYILYKRSAPFMLGDRYRPDLADLFDMYEDLRIIVIYRDPRASTYSSFRRGFVNTLRHAAIITDEQLTYMAAQLATLPQESYMLLNYTNFCSRPSDYVHALAIFSGIDEGLLQEAATQEKVVLGQDDKWRNELASNDVAFLDQYFDDRRQQQWSLLASSKD
jgi:hypothetical protein